MHNNWIGGGGGGSDSRIPFRHSRIGNNVCLSVYKQIQCRWVFIASFDNIIINIPSSNANQCYVCVDVEGKGEIVCMEARMRCACEIVDLSMANRDSYDMTRICLEHQPNGDDWTNDTERSRLCLTYKRCFCLFVSIEYIPKSAYNSTWLSVN